MEVVPPCLILWGSRFGLSLLGIGLTARQFPQKKYLEFRGTNTTTAVNFLISKSFHCRPCPVGFLSCVYGLSVKRNLSLLCEFLFFSVRFSVIIGVPLTPVKCKRYAVTSLIDTYKTYHVFKKVRTIFFHNYFWLIYIEYNWFFNALKKVKNHKYLMQHNYSLSWVCYSLSWILLQIVVDLLQFVVGLVLGYK